MITKSIRFQRTNERTNGERDRAVAFAGKVVTFDASRTDETFGVRGVARRRVTRRRVDFAVEGNERKKNLQTKRRDVYYMIFRRI